MYPVLLSIITDEAVEEIDMGYSTPSEFWDKADDFINAEHSLFEDHADVARETSPEIPPPSEGSSAAGGLVPQQMRASQAGSQPSTSAAQTPGFGWTNTGQAKYKVCKCTGGNSGYGCRVSCPCASAQKKGPHAGKAAEGCGMLCKCKNCVNRWGRHPVNGCTEYRPTTLSRKSTGINFTRLDNLLRMIHTTLRHYDGLDAIETEICKHVGKYDIEDAIKGASKGAQAFYAFLQEDVLLSQDPFRALNDGDALPFYRAIPLYCCAFEYYNLPNIANVALLNLSRVLYWTEKSTTPRPYLNDVDGLSDEARKMKRGDIVATHFGNCRGANEVVQEYSNSQMVGQMKSGSKNDQELFEKKACGIPAKSRILRETKLGVGMDRKGGKAEVRRVIDHYKKEAKKRECLELKAWLVEFTKRALCGDMDEWVRFPIFKSGKEALLERGISRLVASLKKSSSSR